MLGSAITIGHLARPNKAIDFKVSDRTVVGNTTDVLSVLQWISEIHAAVIAQLVPGCNTTANPAWCRIGGVPIIEMAYCASSKSSLSLVGRSFSLTVPFIGRDFRGLTHRL